MAITEEEKRAASFPISSEWVSNNAPTARRLLAALLANNGGVFRIPQADLAGEARQVQFGNIDKHDLLIFRTVDDGQAQNGS